jgi:hypothetical protein
VAPVPTNLAPLVSIEREQLDRLRAENEQLRRTNEQLTEILLRISSERGRPFTKPAPVRAETDPTAAAVAPGSPAGLPPVVAVPATRRAPGPAAGTGSGDVAGGAPNPATSAAPSAAQPGSGVAPGAVSATPADPTLTHWLTTKSGKRHNSKCPFFKGSKGKPCGPNEGDACKVCGG